MSDPTECPQCKGPMKPLFTSWFCPKDCDRPKAAAPATPAEPSAMGNIWVIDPSVWSWGGMLPKSKKPYIPLNNQCRSPHCRALGTKTHSSNTGVGNFDHYCCNLCNDTWAVIV